MLLAGILALPNQATADGAAGHLDPSFGEGGRVARAFAAASASWSNITVELAELRGGKVALLVDDRLVVLDEDGSADRHFGRGGSMQILTPEGTALDPAALATDRSGRILLAGSTSRPAPAIGHESGYVTSLAVIRLTTAGRFDRTFGGGDGALETTLGMPPAFSIASDATSASTTVVPPGS